MSDSINEKLKTMFSKMEDFVSTKTVIGDPYYLGKEGEVIIVPLVDVAFGMGTGLANKSDSGASEAGGGAMGAKLTPAAVVVIVNGTVQLVNVKNQDSVGKLIDMIPGVLSKLNMDSLFSGNKKTETSGEEEL
jgi:uncharacterized spore protein YtfJ